MPLVVSQGAFAVMIFVDRWFLSMVSSTHMAAALGGGVAFFFSFSLFNGILAYANALVAQYLGAREYAKCSRVVTQGVFMSLACIPLLLVIALVFRHIFAAMGHAPEQIALERSYYSILMLGAVLVLIKTCLASFFSGIARTQVIMICEVLGIVVNIPLSYVLIFGGFGLPAMGMEGAAIGTVISTGLGILMFAFFYLQKHNRERFTIGESLCIDKGIIRRYIRLGTPSGMEMFLNVAAFNLFLLMFQSYGLSEAASAAIVFNWDTLSFVPMMGLNIAVMSLIGRFVGAGDMTRTNEVTTAGWVISLCYSSLLALSFILLREPMVELFIYDEENSDAIRALATWMMVGLSTYVILEGLLQVAAGVLRGAGDTRWIMFASVSLHWAMLVAQFFIIKVFELGPRVSWMGFVLMILAISVVFLWRLRSGRWKESERLAQVMAE